MIAKTKQLELNCDRMLAHLVNGNVIRSDGCLDCVFDWVHIICLSTAAICGLGWRSCDGACVLRPLLQGRTLRGGRCLEIKYSAT
jgi:hypothetical protein